MDVNRETFPRSFYTVFSRGLVNAKTEFSRYRYVSNVNRSSSRLYKLRRFYDKLYKKRKLIDSLFPLAQFSVNTFYAVGIIYIYITTIP